ncbi:MAG TPA: hypothetical protein VGN61_03515 [Verrucomicrobiae bacterium]
MKTSEGLGATLCSEDAHDEAPDAKVSPRASRSFPTRRSTVRILIVYEDDLNRDRARQMQEELIQRLGRSFGFSVSWWRLKSLWHPKMLRMATDDATKTDIIMFSLRSGGELPQAIKKWINSVIDNSRRRVSLLALLETGGAIALRVSRTEIFLNHLSSRVGVDSLCYSDGPPTARFTRRREQGNGNYSASRRPTVIFGSRRNALGESSREKVIKAIL